MTSIGSVGTTQAEAAIREEGLSSAALDQEAFLKLLVAQLKNQDPLQPQENAQFVAELAQFSNLEQTMGINDRLDTLALQNQGLSNSQVVSLVGKRATVSGSAVTVDGNGAAAPIDFILDDPSASTSIVIRDSAGRAIRTLEVGAKSAGRVTAHWDGRSDTGLLQPPGTYSVTVEAKNGTGGVVPVTQQTSGTIKSVSFDKGYPTLTLDNGVTASVSDLQKVEDPTILQP